MTTPAERSRALFYTRSFLLELCYGDAAGWTGTALREEARMLLRHFPLPADVLLMNVLAPQWFGPLPDANDDQ